MYDVIYAWCFDGRTTFNPGVGPVREEIATDPLYRREPQQIQLYAALAELVPFGTDEWRRSAVLEVGAGCGGGLRYVARRFQPRESIGIDTSGVAVLRGRWLGIDLRRAEAHRLPFESERFDCLLCVDALNYFGEQRFMAEARRVLRPGGYLLLAESAKAWQAATDRFRRLATAGDFEVEALQDVSEGVRR